MASLESIEEKIEQKVRLMIASFDALKVQNYELRQTISGLEEELKNTKEALNVCREELVNLRLAKATRVSEDEAKKMHNRMLELEREVEKCISLLNE
jgi:hypothetical protein